MEKWFNSRLFAHNPKLNLQGYELVSCHLDIVPRNILWLEDGSMCLVDWASAGYYPRLFEFCMQRTFDRIDGNFHSLLLKLMNLLSDQAMAQRNSILCAWRNIQKYPYTLPEKIIPKIQQIIRLRPPIQCHHTQRTGMKRLSMNALHLDSRLLFQTRIRFGKSGFPLVVPTSMLLTSNVPPTRHEI
ncbi:kinase-like protein [Penicillium canescens]|nr:kinase-like protein [Penicillium canescens]